MLKEHNYLNSRMKGFYTLDIIQPSLSMTEFSLERELIVLQSCSPLDKMYIIISSS